MWVWSLGWEDSPGEGNGTPLEYSCLENPVDRGAWRVAVHRVAKTRLERLGTHAPGRGRVGASPGGALTVGLGEANGTGDRWLSGESCSL